jgi:hypothetical protein
MVGHRDGSSLATTPGDDPLRLTRPQPALVVSLLALFVALGGTSYAAITVTGANVKNGSLTGTDIKNGSLRGADVHNGSLTAGDLSLDTIASLRGATGARGAAGATGAPGTFGAVTVRTVIYTAGAPATASCLTGEVATGGGVASNSPSSFVRVSAPSPLIGTPVGWQGQTLNTANASIPGVVYAVCAKR